MCLYVQWYWYCSSFRLIVVVYILLKCLYTHTHTLAYCNIVHTHTHFPLAHSLTCTHTHTPWTDFTTGQRDALKEQLTRIILRLLAENKELHYYQGLHDIALTLLLVTGEDLAYAIMAVITRYHIR